MGVVSVLIPQRSCLFTNGFRLWPNYRLIVFTPLSHGKCTSRSLSHAQTSSTQIKLNVPDFTPWPISMSLKLFLIHNNLLAYAFALRLHNLLPFWRISLHLPHKDSCLNRRCLLRVVTHTSLSLLAYCQIVTICTCPQTSLTPTATYTLQDLPFLMNST